MKAISIRGPWWWFVLHGEPLKDVENRDWSESYARQQLARLAVGSKLQIHASAEMTKREYEEAIAFARQVGVTQWPHYAWFENRRGGIVGMVEFAGAYRQYQSPWFTGSLGLRLEKPYPLPFVKCRGALGIFEPEVDR